MNIKKDLVNKYFVVGSNQVGVEDRPLRINKDKVFNTLEGARAGAESINTFNNLSICKCTSSIFSRTITKGITYQLLRILQESIFGVRFSPIEDNFDKGRIEDITTKLRVVFVDLPMSVNYDIVEKLPKKIYDVSKIDVEELIESYGVDHLKEIIEEYENEHQKESSK